MHQVLRAAGPVFEVLLALWVMPKLGCRWLLHLFTLPMAPFVCFLFVLMLLVRNTVLSSFSYQAGLNHQWLSEIPCFDLLTGNS